MQGKYLGRSPFVSNASDFQMIPGKAFVARRFYLSVFRKTILKNSYEFLFLVWDFLPLQLKHLIETISLGQPAVRTYGVLNFISFSSVEVRVQRNHQSHENL